MNIDQLFRGGDSGGLQLKQGIFAETGQCDLLHFLVNAGETSELVEERIAPEPLVSIVWQFILVAAEHQPRPRTVFVEIFRNDPILQHAAEG